MTIQKQIEQIQKLKKEIGQIEKNIVKLFEESKDLPLEERWILYTNTEDYLPVDIFITHLETLHKDVVGYDGLVHVENRDSLVYYTTIVDALENEFEYWFKNQKTSKLNKVIEKMIEDGSECLGIVEIEEYDNRIEESFNAQLEAVKLEILSLGTGGYHYDW